jgi:hypothetical protein
MTATKLWNAALKYVTVAGPKIISPSMITRIRKDLFGGSYALDEDIDFWADMVRCFLVTTYVFPHLNGREKKVMSRAFFYRKAVEAGVNLQNALPERMLNGMEAEFVKVRQFVKRRIWSGLTEVHREILHRHFLRIDFYNE